MDIEIVMKKLYDSEINCSISNFRDNGWDVKLGDRVPRSRSAEALC
jgi:hypothetical protein